MALENSLSKQQKKTGIAAYLTQDAVKKQINSIVGGKNGARFLASIVSAVQTNPALQECTNQSIVSAALLGEALNLSPSPQLGQFYMIPYKKKAKTDRNGIEISPAITQAQFQIGYKGYIQLAIRSGYYKKLNVMVIKEGELIHYDPIEEKIEVALIEDDVEREQAETIGYYAMFEYENGFKKSMYWSKKKMIVHADKYSSAFNKKIMEQIEAEEIPSTEMWKYSSFWYKDFDGMALKTMLRQLISKWGIMSIELQTALDKDMAVIQEDGTAIYIDNEEAILEQEYEEIESEPDNSQEVPEDGQQSFF